MVDSSKFSRRSSLILCPLERVTTIITDPGIDDAAAKMIENAGVKLLIANGAAGDAGKEEITSVA
jgi:DeoR family ulaG and ulaABCDEF operon transcriptional repressor